MTIFPYQKDRGTGLIEVIVASSIVVLVMVGIVSMYRLLIRSSREAVRGTQSVLLVEEGLEVARVLRDSSWSAIASSTPGTSYTPTWNGTAWSLSTTPSLIDGTFDRRLVISRVYRDASDDIAPAGTLDPQTFRIDVTVSWDTGFLMASRTMSSYLSNIFE